MPAPAPQRLASLDAFRGLVIVVMFLVNVGGTDPAFPAWFPHRGWNNGAMGNGLADFVFPCFLFIVGAAVPLSLSAGRGKGVPFWRRALSALRRGVTIYLLGTVIWCATIAYDKPITAQVLLHWDILPLIGFSYFLTVLLCHTPRWARIAFVVAVLVFKWAILTQIPLPGANAVVWTEHDSYQNHLRTALGWWGVALTQGLATTATTVLGALATDLIRTESIAPPRRAALLAARGGALIAASYVWHRFGGMPYSKDFFTASYVLVMAGTGCVCLAFMYYLMDVTGRARFSFLRIYGSNAIAAYFLAEFMWKTVFTRWKLVTPTGDSSVFIASFKAWVAWALGSANAGAWGTVALYILFYWLICYALYRKGWFVKV